jgi:hypothetical protein
MLVPQRILFFMENAMDFQQKRYLTENEVSKLTGRALQTLRNDRFRGRGFNYIKMGRSIRYDMEDILCFMELNKIRVENHD